MKPAGTAALPLALTARVVLVESKVPSELEQLLVVQAAVPVPLSAFAARDYIVNVLDETLRLGKAFVARRKLKVSTTTIESVLTEMLHRAPEVRIE